MSEPDVAAAFSDPQFPSLGEICAVPHPDLPVVCDKPKPCYAFHQATEWDVMRGTTVTTWMDEKPAMPPKPTKEGNRSRAQQMADGVKRPTRGTDPQTSHDAARTTREELRQSQAEVLGLFDDEDLTDEDMIRKASSTEVGIHQSSSGLRTRRSELVDMGYLVDSGRKGRTVNDRDTIIWTKAPVAELADADGTVSAS